MSNLTMESLLETMRACAHPPELDRWIFVNRGDYLSMVTAAPGIASNLPAEVKPSDYVPKGQVYSIAKRDVLQSIKLDHQFEMGRVLAYDAWIPFLGGISLGVSPFLFGYDAVGAVPYLTKAQRRRRAKRFIREEVSRRRMLKLQEGR